MSLSARTIRVLSQGLTKRSLAEEIDRRLISETPETAQEAQDILDTLDLSDRTNQKLSKALNAVFASKERGQEVYAKLSGMVSVLQALANGAEVGEIAGEKATFTGSLESTYADLELIADDVDEADITLEFDGETTVQEAINAWNVANPENTVLVDAGDASIIPVDNFTIVLEGSDTEIEASFADDVTVRTAEFSLEADDAGELGNATIAFAGILDIDDTIAAWNIANPTKAVTLTDGDGSQIPDNLQEAELEGGTEITEASDADITAEQEAMGDDEMSARTLRSLKVAIQRTAAEEIETAYNLMIEKVQDIVPEEA